MTKKIVTWVVLLVVFLPLNNRAMQRRKASQRQSNTVELTHFQEGCLDVGVGCTKIVMGGLGGCLTGGAVVADTSAYAPYPAKLLLAVTMPCVFAGVGCCYGGCKAAPDFNQAKNHFLCAAIKKNQ